MLTKKKVSNELGTPVVGGRALSIRCVMVMQPLTLCTGPKLLLLCFGELRLISFCLICTEWMSHRKQKDTKQQPGTAGPGNILGCCLVSLCFLCDIHSILLPTYYSTHEIGSVTILYVLLSLNLTLPVQPCSLLYTTCADGYQSDRKWTALPCRFRHYYASEPILS